MSEGKRPTSLMLRIASALVLAPLTLFVVVAGGWPFTIFVALAFFLTFYEWMKIRPVDVPRALMFLQGLFYLGVCYCAFVYLRGMEHGLALTFALLLCVWASDSGAYLAGKTIGGPKMAPTISPNKTWAGFGGALFFSGLTLLLLTYIFPLIPGISLPAISNIDRVFIFAAGLLFGAAGQAGDLFISQFKRRAGVKDTGHLIPGHGGILDRIDALLLVSPLLTGAAKLWLH